MRKIMVKVIGIMILAAICLGVFCACKKSDESVTYFGEFGCYGNYLTERAVNTISAAEAKQLIAAYDLGAYVANAEQSEEVTLSAAPSALSFSLDASLGEKSSHTPLSLVDSLITKYSGFVVTTKYYDANDELGLEGTLKEKRDEYIGGTFKSVLEENYLEPFAQLLACNIIAYDGLVEWMEEKNTEFAASEAAKIAPFLNIYTYHTDGEGRLIVQAHYFQEINAKEVGGINSNFRQDTEIVYDSEGKMTFWQTSLGISNASPTGTMRQGYILSLDLEWFEKK